MTQDSQGFCKTERDNGGDSEGSVRSISIHIPSVLLPTQSKKNYVTDQIKGTMYHTDQSFIWGGLKLKNTSFHGGMTYLSRVIKKSMN